ncbi:sphingomyelin phosphodiesterase, putative [Entamoeba invadens IP1]|uniref:Sphingomyelin phosphodiesterase, putative n=1 Tax=Entamoeba invadens IP1 TaxID=370355 RepID=A0A0A1U6Y3_ENTIV|nr:sphingomyelin phosphodiesterase, putative [Entamoeba invadens IP1]ELP90152.1 sphingomyelin phosphodiesterase, putative [Entamoeba invadens IP1]|eukprot:XP_004256923.1 sphingomyelin phosphodiesterase, putative [Entamoeba invadens IP1]
MKVFVIFFSFLFLFISGKIVDFIQIADVHYDKFMDCSLYDDTTNCRTNPFVTFSSTNRFYHKYKTNPMYNPMFGRYFCDSNKNLFLESVQQAFRVSPHPKFIILSGDLPAHAPGEYFQDTMKEGVNIVQRRFPGVPIVFCLGNNEVEPAYITSCDDKRYEKYFQFLNTTYIPLSEKESFVRHASYVRHLNHLQLTVVMINTLLYSPRYKGEDCGSLEHIREGINHARALGNSVLVVGHFPIGVSAFDCRSYMEKSIQDRLFNILQANEDIIIGNIFGHCHRDEIKVVNGVTAMTSISVSPFLGNAPGIRVYSYDINKRKLYDYVDYFMYFVKSSLKEKGIWTAGFSFKQLYGVEDASPNSIKEALKHIKRDHLLYLNYSMFTNGLFDPDFKNTLCRITSNNIEEGLKCQQSLL